MKLELLTERLCVCKVKSLDRIGKPEGFFSVTVTDSEISVVCAEKALPANALQAEKGWRAVRVCGALDFSLTGILYKIAGVFAAQQIPIFALSTYNTDYILFKEEYLEKAVCALKANGYEII